MSKGLSPPGCPKYVPTYADRPAKQAGLACFASASVTVRIFVMTVLSANTNQHQYSKIKSAHVFDIVKFMLLMGVLVWLLFRGTERLGYNWQWVRALRYIFYIENGMFHAGPIINGVWVTIQITAISLILAFWLGLLSALLRLSHSLAARLLARGYLELVRNTPLLVQLFLVYFVLAPILDIGRFSSAVLTLSLFEGAYASEIFRAGIISIRQGQWEAAASLGLDAYHTYRHVILPQAIRWVLPPLTSQAVSLVKDSALVSTIAIYDLTMQGQAIISETYLVFEIWFIVAFVYLLITGTLSVCISRMEVHLKIRT